MITLVEALNYRCLRYISQPLGPFHVLVGANASGKSTFLDVVSFLGRLVSSGLDAAVAGRTSNFADLVFGRNGTRFELAVEARIPTARQELLPNKSINTIRYDVAIGLDEISNEVRIFKEAVLLKSSDELLSEIRAQFPSPLEPTKSILAEELSNKISPMNWVARKDPDGLDTLYPELNDASPIEGFVFGPKKSPFANLPEDEKRFPVSTWFKGLLKNADRKIILNRDFLLQASPIGHGRDFKPDGSNLPWMIEDFKKKITNKF